MEKHADRNNDGYVDRKEANMYRHNNSKNSRLSENNNNKNQRNPRAQYRNKGQQGNRMRNQNASENFDE